MIEPMPARLPLPTLLSQVLVAYTIECDNEAEHRMSHRTTTAARSPDAPRDAPWLTSMVMWANVLQYIEGDGITVARLHQRARTAKDSLAGLQRWGYVTVTPDPADRRPTPPPGDLVVRTTAAGRRAQEVWRPLPAEVSQRWHTRFGPDLPRLIGSLRAVVDRVGLDFPAFLPIVSPTQNEKAAVPPVVPPAVPPMRSPRSPAPGLSELLTSVLLAFTVDFERQATLSLPIAANTLRVLDATGVRVRDLPRRTGISKEATAMCVGFLARRACVEVVPDPASGRGKVVRLTARGMRSQEKYRRLLRATEADWRTTFGARRIDGLRSALQRLAGPTGTLESSPLAPALVPYPEGWRARVRPPETLPHYPMVLHRGGYPDGS
jgi:DNA-binding MarR family transcriptional regulator